jgi:hypothetical protein
MFAGKSVRATLKTGREKTPVATRHHDSRVTIGLQRALYP